MAQYTLIDLNDPEAVRSFAYKGKKNMAEDEVKSAMKSTLEGRSYEVQVKWGRKSGSDIVAICGNRCLVIEVKGEGSSRQMLGNFFLCALGEILQRMSDNTASYAIAFPAHASYVELVLKLPKRVREALQLDFYFVRPKETVHEVGVLRWQVGYSAHRRNKLKHNGVSMWRVIAVAARLKPCPDEKRRAEVRRYVTATEKSGSKTR